MTFSEMKEVKKEISSEKPKEILFIGNKVKTFCLSFPSFRVECSTLQRQVAKTSLGQFPPSFWISL